MRLTVKRLTQRPSSVCLLHRTTSGATPLESNRRKECLLECPVRFYRGQHAVPDSSKDTTARDQLLKLARDRPYSANAKSKPVSVGERTGHSDCLGVPFSGKPEWPLFRRQYFGRILLKKTGGNVFGENVPAGRFEPEAWAAVVTVPGCVTRPGRVPAAGRR